MNKTIAIAVVMLILVSGSLSLFAGGKKSDGDGYYVETGNGREQTLGGKSGSKSEKGLSNAAEKSGEDRGPQAPGLTEIPPDPKGK